MIPGEGKGQLFLKKGWLGYTGGKKSQGCASRSGMSVGQGKGKRVESQKVHIFNSKTPALKHDARKRGETCKCSARSLLDNAIRIAVHLTTVYKNGCLRRLELKFADRRVFFGGGGRGHCALCVEIPIQTNPIPHILASPNRPSQSVIPWSLFSL